MQIIPWQMKQMAKQYLEDFTRYIMDSGTVCCLPPRVVAFLQRIVDMHQHAVESGGKSIHCIKKNGVS